MNTEDFAQWAAQEAAKAPPLAPGDAEPFEYLRGEFKSAFSAARAQASPAHSGPAAKPLLFLDLVARAFRSMDSAFTFPDIGAPQFARGTGAAEDQSHASVSFHANSSADVVLSATSSEGCNVVHVDVVGPYERIRPFSVSLYSEQSGLIASANCTAPDDTVTMNVPGPGHFELHFQFAGQCPQMRLEVHGETGGD